MRFQVPRPGGDASHTAVLAVGEPGTPGSRSLTPGEAFPGCGSPFGRWENAGVGSRLPSPHWARWSTGSVNRAGVSGARLDRVTLYSEVPPCALGTLKVLRNPTVKEPFILFCRMQPFPNSHEHRKLFFTR